MRPLLILRPELGSAATAARAAALGLPAVEAPLFAVRPVGWTPPDPAAFDALLLTSAHAVRQAGPALGLYRHLPVHAVGAATAAAARDAGLTVATIGTGDATAAMAAAGSARLLHLTGREHRATGATRVIVYASEALDALPDAAAAALTAGAVALIHSPRAGGLLATLAAGIDRSRAAIVAISPAAAAPVGDGWQTVAAAERPTDDAMLAVAARLCDGPAR